MDEKTKPIIFMASFFIFVIAAAFIIGGLKGAITGEVVAEDCFVECSNNSGCDDNNPCTLDGCAYAGSCFSRCTYVLKEDCEY